MRVNVSNRNTLILQTDRQFGIPYPRYCYAKHGKNPHGNANAFFSRIGSTVTAAWI